MAWQGFEAPGPARPRRDRHALRLVLEGCEQRLLLTVSSPPDSKRCYTGASK
jgi:hypothetical protein